MNFGLEVAIVVVAVLFSGTAPVAQGTIQIGSHCYDPLQSARRATEYTSPMWDNPDSEREFYTDFCHRFALNSQDTCDSELGAFPRLYRTGSREASALAGAEEAATGCVWGPRPVTTMEVRLAVLAVLHTLMAMYQRRDTRTDLGALDWLCTACVLRYRL
eukprot:SAG25_NODE_259_length_10888_cov_14.204468_5_plen_160_part_00